MKTIRVVAAIIYDGDRIFATQRGYGDWKDFWEFPGGKIESGERIRNGADLSRSRRIIVFGYMSMLRF